MKWIVIIIVVAAAAYGGWRYWKKPGEQAPEYRTAIVSRGEIVQAVTASGQLNPVLNVQIGSQISGMIQKLYVDFNSSVTQGQVIAEIDPGTYRANMLQAEGDLANARAALELARIEARRAGELLQSRLIPQADNDKAVAQLHQAEAQVKIREATLEKARVDLDRCTIYAPTNGIVISRNVDVGQTVAASFSSPTLFVIANDLRRMQIDAMVSEADVGGVEERQKVNFSVDAFPGRTFQGEVIQIRNSPVTNQNVVSYDAVVAVDNRDMKLKPGMTANVGIITAQKEDVVRLPNAALRYRPPEAAERTTTVSSSGSPRPGGGGDSNSMRRARGGRRGGSGEEGAGRSRPERVPQRTIYILASTNAVAGQPSPKPEPRQVRIGISDGVFTEVIDGLEEGEIVVLGSNMPDSARGGPGGASNPFGGSRRRF